MKRNLETSFDEKRLPKEKLKNFLHDAKRKRLTKKEERELALKASSGDTQALDRLVEGNLLFVAYIVLQKYGNTKHDPLDLVQQGCIGLMQAAEKYSQSYDVRFCTFAYSDILSSINLYLHADGQFLRLPKHAKDLQRSAKRFMQEFESINYHLPSIDQLAEVLGKDEELIRSVLEADLELSSLDMPYVCNEEWDCFESCSDYLVADWGNPEETHDKEHYSWLTGRLLDRLDLKHRKVIEMSYGIGRPLPESNDTIAFELGLTPQRVGQMANEALSQLKKICDESHLAA